MFLPSQLTESFFRYRSHILDEFQLSIQFSNTTFQSDDQFGGCYMSNCDVNSKILELFTHCTILLDDRFEILIDYYFPNQWFIGRDHPRYNRETPKKFFKSYKQRLQYVFVYRQRISKDNLLWSSVKVFVQVMLNKNQDLTSLASTIVPIFFFCLIFTAIQSRTTL